MNVKEPRKSYPRFSREWWVQHFVRVYTWRNFIWITVVLGVLLNILASWLISPGGISLNNTLLSRLLRSPLLDGIGGGLLLLLVIVTIVGKKSAHIISHQEPSSNSSLQDRQALLRILRHEYDRQTKLLLQNGAKIRVEMQERLDAVRSPTQQLVSWRLDTPEVRQKLPIQVSILDVYDEASHGLLILGAPGAGKSTLLLELASKLLDRVEQQDDPHLIPLLVNLSSWAAKKQPLETWLLGHLQIVYALPRYLSAAWIKQNVLLFLLDGLDEVEESARSACIEEINAYRTRHFIPLVICSRSEEYLTQAGRLQLPMAVEVQSLTYQQVDTYLAAAGKTMAVLRTVLKLNPILQQLVTTPLMLTVVMLTYQGATVKDLPRRGSAEEQQRQVFAQYVNHILTQSARKEEYPARETRQWLSWLAKQMLQRHLTDFYLEYLQSNWLPTPKIRFIYNATTVTLGELFVGPPFGLITGSFFSLLLGPLLGLVLGLIAWLLSGTLFGLSEYHLPETIHWKWAQLQESASSLLIVGLITGGVVGMIVGSLVWLVFELMGLVGGLLVGIGVGLLFGLVASLLVVILSGLSEEPHPEIIRWEWARAQRRWAFVLGAGLIAGIGGGLLAGQPTGSFFGILAGLGVGLAVGFSSDRIHPDELKTPDNFYRSAKRIGSLSGLSTGLFAGLLFGLFTGLFKGLALGLLEGLLTALGIGLLVGLLFGLGLIIHRKKLMIFLRCLGATPKNYVQFLDYATSRILLLRAGGGYRFFHRLLLEYFASLEEVSIAT